MAKKVAVLVVNPVNGAGLFQYLEAFFENGIPYRTFAVSESTDVKTNSGISMQTDDVIANLKGHENEYDALVFACGDAMPKFGENADMQFNQDMLVVMKNFADKGKTMIGHCAAALLYDTLGIAEGKRVALHPFIKTVVKSCIGTDEKAVVDGNFYTAQTENTLGELIPELLKVLK
ncbi:protease [Paludibacter sp. 221]|uniref:DJ-1/PfpI family protein n=1 Tax=Paludibacter sp. 221 TaxID=2302939 RepID=UPI0013D40928|nr:DJ-1/PfpI family protein [Paludibacter sp. 221]NDV47205.1 protease [Paludibacter sp. 221]